MSDDFDFDDDFFGDDDDEGGLDDINNLRDDDDFGSFDSDSFFDDGEDAGGASDSAFFEDDDEFDGFGDDDDFGDLDDYDEDFFEEEAATDEGGPSRTFVIIAIGMFVIFLLGIVLIAIIALTGGGEDSTVEATRVAFESTSNAIGTNNAMVLTDTILTETQSVINQTADAQEFIANATATAEAEIAGLTATAEAESFALTETAEALTAVVLSQTPLVDLTAQEQARIAQLTADAAEVTADVEPTEMVTSNAVDPDLVAQTATALQLTLFPVTTPTIEGGGSQSVATVIPNSGGTPNNQLPETGLNFDSQSLPMIALIVFGLVGVIFGARQLRSNNKNNNITKK